MMTRHALMALLAAALLIAIFALLRTDDDVAVDRSEPAAAAAIEAARAVVPGELVDVSRDTDSQDKWEVTLRAHGQEYEVELLPDTLALLRIDYD
ncbi:hypothetical protein DVA67_013510 [Solirubrobacter sp. CPCC 204708]|uniref:PepSY domain-containing protein n=1 Tax=Solirubrobacter deserti TaxID=2282478 RepID=A0ABT4RC53_9ACTN|nr:hypothetical protein [Solirubrobacter deserti]MBE2316994.1 hypothetical protein [Solirubrobacter deserti]MDA0136114.1 hypothetical protein [Solirubrobacter deserti]